jgi:cyclopropane fatty-acyl-phospholipid synthase-like methyltransferase
MGDLHEYTEEFFEYIERGSIASAKRLSEFVVPLLGVSSILDVGCGRGAWLREWQNAGVKIAKGVDGPYVRQQSLLIDAQDFTAVDLSEKFDLGRRFDLVISLEVAEHLPRSCSEAFISSLVKHADLVLFSAATPGQGGENHINERPLSFWQDIFRSKGYEAYDVIRPVFRANKSVEPWYRFNTILYANERIRSSLPAAVTSAAVEPGRLREIGNIGWRARKSILRMLPSATVTTLSRWNYQRLNRAHKRGVSSPSSTR